MAMKTLICGLSGTGKSRSMKEFAEQGIPVAIVNPVNKPLPFRNKFEALNGETDSRKIVKFMKNTTAKVIVVDDFQYLLAIPYMRRVKEAGWDKYNDFAANYYEIIDICNDLPEDTTVYFMTHTETLEDGTETVKLIGKLLREKICIEGLFTIVLKTLVNDGHYYFVTQNNGRDTVKSPEDMFPSYAIDNNLKYVDDKIRNYYNIPGCLTDEEMAEVDQEEKREEVEKSDGKKKRGRRSKYDSSSDTGNEGPKFIQADSAGADNPGSEGRGNSESDSGTDEVGSTNRTRQSFEKAKRKSREQVQQENSEKVANAGLGEAGDEVEVPFENVDVPDLEKLPPKKRERKKRDGENKDSIQQNAETEGVADDIGDVMPAPETNTGEDQPGQPEETADAETVSKPVRRRRRKEA